MNASSVLAYPASPSAVDENIIQPSSAFKKEVVKVLLAILFFIGTYLLLMATAVLLALICGYGGVMLMIAFPKFLTLMVGIGLIGLGVMVIFFLLKFLFRRTVVDRSDLVLVTAKDQPVLFDFIRKLAKETQTPFPKKIYLSPDVNACVFYNAGFWSMFLPVRKNLQIGLGLVNAVNVSEFKAIVAHEFGHFSQRSMKLGSYVYNVNKVIYNMLYDNEGYEETLYTWANLGWYFSIFAKITAGIVNGIQWILQRVYAVVNKRYMALSRQMEFHADAVAASVSGSDPLITSLRRLDVANMCYERVLHHYNEWCGEGKKSDNIYQCHTEVMNHFAESHGLKMEGGIIQVTAQLFGQYNKSRIVVKDQWASHPSTEDREAHLNSLNIHASLVTLPAWSLFTNVEKLQQALTDRVYATVTFEKTPDPVGIADFCRKYHEEVDLYTLDKRYKGFYDARNIHPFDIDGTARESTKYNGLEEILNETTLRLPFLISGIEGDLQTLRQIQQVASGIKTFEFGGERRSQADIPALVTQLNRELEEAQIALEDTDKNIFRFFHGKAIGQNEGDMLLDDYRKMFDTVKSTEAEMKELDRLMQEVGRLYQEDVDVTLATAVTNMIKRQEVQIKENIRQMLDAGHRLFCTDADKKKLQNYLEDQREYFNPYGFNSDALALFTESMEIYQSMIAGRSFASRKQVLTAQLRLLN
ncbi:MAG TPA: M48 family metallopeptidase [Ohtaekwangia sp.]|nr:M48 family metallopeptidase [Ohtaekwangia sp.]